MKKIALTITILGGILNGFADECKHLWFNQKQQNAQFVDKERTKKVYKYARLKDNREVLYTSVSNNDFSPNTSFKDSIYLGCGFLTNHTEISDLEQYHTTKPNQGKYKEALEKNIRILDELEESSSNKFDSLFEKYSKIYKINKDFIKKIAILESGLDENRLTESHFKNDIFVGLFQLSANYHYVNTKNIDSEDITNKAVKHMRYCLDNKGYTINMIDCINKGYSVEVKKELLKILNKDLVQ